MHSVDYAFRSILRRMPRTVTATFFYARSTELESQPPSAENVELLCSPSQLQDFDVIIYWGDFLQWLAYGQQDWQMTAGPANAEAPKIDNWFELMLLEGADKSLKQKTILFGGSIYGLNARQLKDLRYRNALSDLLQNARLVMMRDQVSAHFVSQVAARPAPSLGCDCALLLDREALGIPPRRPENLPEKYLAASFGRSGANRLLQALAMELASRLNLKVVMMDWFGSEPDSAGLAHRLDIINHAEFVLTDIYHLSVNAWREGTPALCAGRGASYPVGTLAEKKKEIFYQQIGAIDYYLFIEDLQIAIGSDKAMAKYSNRLIELLDESDSLDMVFEILSNQVSYARAKLIEAIEAA